MRTLSCMLSLLLLPPCLASAVDLATKDGVTYADATITETLPIGLSFISHGKAGWIDFRDLSDDVAKEYGYNRKKAEAFEAQLAENKGNMVSPSDAPDLGSMPPDAGLNAQAVPPTAENTVVVNPGQTVVYEPTYFPSTGPVYLHRWVYWHGRHYPWYWWHHWYWGHHWVYSHGRYYPWHYYHGHGLWHHGRYYPYHHGLLGKERCKETGPHSHHATSPGGSGKSGHK